MATQQRTTTQAQKTFPLEATKRALTIADGIFPVTFRAGVPDDLRLGAGLLARCVTTTEACVHLAQLGRRSEIMICARTLYEHTVMLAWLFGGDDRPERFLLWQRHCDEQALRMDNEIVRLGGDQGIPERTRAEIARSTEDLGNKKLPGIADRAAQADREWATRLGLDPAHRSAWSLRHMYSVVFRVGSAISHPTLAGLQLVTDKTPGGVWVGVEPSGRSHEALLPVPVLIGTALAVSSSALGRPDAAEINKHVDWLTDAMAAVDWSTAP